MVKLKKERRNTIAPMNLIESNLNDITSGGLDQEKSVVFRTDSRIRETFVDSVARSKKELSRFALTRI